MQTGSTEYQLVSTSHQYKQCHELLKANPISVESDADRELGFPTVVALRDGKAIGFLASAPLRKAKAVVAHCIRVDKDIPNQVFTIMRLIEAYEVVLKTAGCTQYLVPVAKATPKLLNIVKKVIGEPYAEDDRNLWFKREIMT